jgi:hypothetical protein
MKNYSYNIVKSFAKPLKGGRSLLPISSHTDMQVLIMLLFIFRIISSPEGSYPGISASSWVSMFMQFYLIILLYCPSRDDPAVNLIIISSAHRKMSLYAKRQDYKRLRSGQILAILY